jgi:hypothetical protein
LLDDLRQGLRTADLDDAALISPDAEHAVALDACSACDLRIPCQW